MIKGGKIAGWKRLSAEEASKVMVQALATGDAALLDSLMATPEELAAAGVPKAVIDKVTAGAGKRAEAVEALQKALTGWTPKTVWNRFDGTYPHVIPADPASGPGEGPGPLRERRDLRRRRRARARPTRPRSSFLQVPEMIKLGETWKFVELPRAVDPEKPVVASAGGIRAAIFDAAAPRSPARRGDGRGPQGPGRLRQRQRQAPGQRRQERRGAVPRRPDPAPERDRQGRQGRRRTSSATSKQIVDSLVAAYQTGAYPKGRQVLEGIDRARGPSSRRTRPTASSAPIS